MRYVRLFLALFLVAGLIAADLPQTVYPSAQNARAKLVTILTQPTRGTTEQSNATALITTWSLTSINVASFGRFANAKGDNSVAITSGTKALTSTAGLWLASDVGRTIDVAGAGTAGGTLRTTIAAYVSAGSVTLADNASTTVTPSTTSAAGLAIWGDPAGLVLGSTPLKETDGSVSYPQVLDLTAMGNATYKSTRGSTSRTLAARSDDFVNVLDFGADSTGSADSLAAFNAARDALPSTGGTIRVPAGKYLISGEFDCSAKFVRLIGDGWKSISSATVGDSQWLPANNPVYGTALYLTAASGNLIKSESGSLNPRLDLKDIALIGGGSSTSVVRSNGANAPVFWRWDNVFIANGGNGVYLVNAYDGQFSHVSIRGSTYGWNMLTCSQLVFNNLMIESTSNAGLVTNNCDQIAIYGGLIQGNLGMGMNHTSLFHSLIANIWFENSGATDWSLYFTGGGTAQGVTVKNCRFTSSASGGIMVDNYAGCGVTFEQCRSFNGKLQTSASNASAAFINCNFAASTQTNSGTGTWYIKGGVIGSGFGP